MTMENMTMETSIDHHRSHLPMPSQKKYPGHQRFGAGGVLHGVGHARQHHGDDCYRGYPRGGGDPAREMVSSHDFFMKNIGTSGKIIYKWRFDGDLMRFHGILMGYVVGYKVFNGV